MKLGSAADFLLDISETDLSTLTASIKAPSGRDEPCLLKRLPNNHIGACLLGGGLDSRLGDGLLRCFLGGPLGYDMVNLLGHMHDESLHSDIDTLGHSGLLEI